jgi:hypothetical protein
MVVFSLITKILTWIVFLRGVAAPRRVYCLTLTGNSLYRTYTETEFLDEIQTKSSLLFTVTTTVYSFALSFMFLQTRTTAYSF